LHDDIGICINSLLRSENDLGSVEARPLNQPLYVWPSLVVRIGRLHAEAHLYHTVNCPPPFKERHFPSYRLNPPILPGAISQDASDSANEGRNSDILTSGLENKAKVGQLHSERCGHTCWRARFLKVFVVFIPKISVTTAFKTKTAEQNVVFYLGTTDMPNALVSLGASTWRQGANQLFAWRVFLEQRLLRWRYDLRPGYLTRVAGPGTH
jgi:hypothetical protein